MSAIERPVSFETRRATTGNADGVFESVRQVPEHGRQGLLSLEQRYFWFLDQLEPGNSQCMVFQAMRLIGPLDQMQLQTSLNHIVEQHEILRTNFFVSEGSAVQQVTAPLSMSLSLIDLAAVAEEKREAEARRRLESEVQKPFDLTNDLNIHAVLVRLADEDHVLLLAAHQIAADEDSLQVLFEELASLYRANGSTDVVDVPPMQYLDYVIRQQERERDSKWISDLEYWRKQLRTETPRLDFPRDRQASVSRAGWGMFESLILSPQLTARLKSLSRNLTISMFAVLLAAFSVLLYRNARQESFHVGTPVAARTRTEARRLVGLIRNVLMVRADLSGNPGFRAAARRIEAAVEEARKHSSVPLKRVLEESRSPRGNVQRTPFQVMFDLRAAPRPPDWGDGLHAEWWPLSICSRAAELWLRVEESPDTLALRLEYDRDRFAPEMIRNLLEQLETLLHGIVSNSGECISRLPLLTPRALERLLVEWNQTDEDFPSATSYAEHFARRSEIQPERTALRCNGEGITYRQLNERAQKLASHLRTLGVGSETVVGVCLDRSVALAVALIGVFKTGAAYLPLDPAYPQSRLQFMLADSAAKLVLTQRALLPNIPDGSTAFCMDDPQFQAAVARAGSCEHVAGATPDNLAYIIYTSGSTGTPKGVEITQRSLLNHNFAMMKIFGLRPEDRVLQFASISFDLSVEEFFPTWLAGATLVFRTDEALASMERFLEFISAEGVSVLNLPTAYWHELVDFLAGCKRLLPDCIRLVVVGGERVSQQKFELWPKHVSPSVRLINGYGPTETTVTATTYEANLTQPNEWLGIGRTVPNAKAYVLDEQMQPVPIGAIGELFIGGIGVARGYRNRSELTREKFVENPFNSNGTSQRLYRTGDLVRYRADGNLDFIGRRDDQVKVRGFRIEPGEIEAALREHGFIKEAVVVTHDASGEDRQLIAYIVLADCNGDAPSPTDLAMFLKNKLPHYMVPARFVMLKELPRLPNGKIDRKSLPAPEQTRLDIRDGGVPPRTPVEQEIARIWRDVLGVKEVSVRDNFFDLGGHSLLAVRMAGHIEDTFGRILTLGTIFEAATIERLAAVINNGHANSKSLIVPIQTKGTRPPLFLVHGMGSGMFWGYIKLSRLLGRNQPVYSIKSRGMDGEEEYATIEEMAERYVSEIRSVQPRGPYYIGGYCFGGNVAYEMARQLVEQGDQIAFLGLMNCMPANSSYDQVRLTPGFAWKFAVNSVRWLNYFRNWTPSERRDLIRRKGRQFRKKISGLISSRSGSPVIDADDLFDLSAYLDYQRRLWDVHLRAYVAHQTKPFDGHVTLLRSKIHPVLCSFDHACGWNELAKGGVTVRIVPGAHESILKEPHVKSLAREVENCFRKSQRTPRDEHA